MAGSDARADAEVIPIGAGGGIWVSEATPNALLGTDSPEEDGHNGYRSAWWQFTPASDGPAVFDTTLQVWWDDTVLYVFHEDGGTLYADAYSNNYGGDYTSRVEVALSGGVTYWVRVAALYNDVMEYLLQAQWQPAALPLAGTLDAEVALAADLLPEPGALAGGVHVDVQVAGQLVAALTVPVAESLAEAPAPALIGASLVLVEPADGAVLPSLRPAFVVAVSTDDTGVRVEVQFAALADFTAAVVLFSEDTAETGVAGDLLTCAVPADAPLTDDAVYFWRARAVTELGETPWVGPRTFAANELDGVALAAGSWTVDAAVVAVPDLWAVAALGGNTAGDPSVDADGEPVGADEQEPVVTDGAPGTPAVAYGTAFADPAVVTVGGTPAVVLSTEAVAAGAAAYTGERVIDPDDGRIDVWHQRVEFTVPVLGEEIPGGAVHIEGG